MNRILATEPSPTPAAPGESSARTAVSRPNRAAWLPAKGADLEVKSTAYASPRASEITVRNRAVAVNPIDWILQLNGNLGFGWIRFPFILGSDLAGEVVEVGSGVSRFKAGDRVLAHAVGTDPKRNSSAEGSFQRYTVVLENMASPIPDNLSYERAAVLPLGLSTAACGLFQSDFLALTRPSVPAKPNGKTLLVWGGSTSVGSNAVQLAVAAGYDVVTTCSPRNFRYVEKLGARHAFDYNSAMVVRDLIAALKGKSMAGAFAIGLGSTEACVDVLAACEGNKFVSMATFPITFDGAPGIGRTVKTVRQLLGFNIRMFFKTRMTGVRTKFIFGSSLIHNDLGRAIYADFLPQALAQGAYITAPDPLVVGSGLEALQTALHEQRKGVSAAKIVVSLPAQ